VGGDVDLKLMGQAVTLLDRAVELSPQFSDALYFSSDLPNHQLYSSRSDGKVIDRTEEGAIYDELNRRLQAAAIPTDEMRRAAHDYHLALISTDWRDLSARHKRWING
jgi:hypothetical protein